MTNSEAVVICNDLTVQHGEVVAVNAVSLSVLPGERVFLIGQSGAGKSTILDAAAGLVRPTSGSISILGADVSQLSGKALREHRTQVGIISQGLGLAPALRVVHSVNGGRLGQWSTGKALGSLIRPSERTDVEKALDAVGLSDRIDARTGDLSGGERQRIAVARTLVQAPKLILADEPTSSLDPDLANRIMALLCATSESQTVVVSVHDPELALVHGDRIIGLASGKVVFDRQTADVSRSDVTALYERKTR